MALVFFFTWLWNVDGVAHVLIKGEKNIMKRSEVPIQTAGHVPSQI